MAIPEMLSAAVPVLVRVTPWGTLVVPTSCGEKVRLVGTRLATGATPVPVRLTASGLSPALSVIVTAAFHAPMALGVKVTVIAQLAPAAKVPVALPLEMQLFFCAKSEPFGPVMLMAVMLSVALPVLVRIALWAVLVVPTF